MDPIEKRVRDAFAQQPMMQTLGAEVFSAKPGEVVLKQRADWETCPAPVSEAKPRSGGGLSKRLSTGKARKPANHAVRHPRQSAIIDP